MRQLVRPTVVSPQLKQINLPLESTPSTPEVRGRQEESLEPPKAQRRGRSKAHAQEISESTVRKPARSMPTPRPSTKETPPVAGSSRQVVPARPPPRGYRGIGPVPFVDTMSEDPDVERELRLIEFPVFTPVSPVAAPLKSELTSCIGCTLRRL